MGEMQTMLDDGIRMSPIYVKALAAMEIRNQPFYSGKLRHDYAIRLPLEQSKPRPPLKPRKRMEPIPVHERTLALLESNEFISVHELDMFISRLIVEQQCIDADICYHADESTESTTLGDKIMTQPTWMPLVLRNG